MFCLIDLNLSGCTSEASWYASSGIRADALPVRLNLIRCFVDRLVVQKEDGEYSFVSPTEWGHPWRAQILSKAATKVKP